ncbi:MAG: hypothetical protein MUO62_10300 [Anaerolineales bacterium]|nr:hypothetical protein [Anaerolineales bacterium]
MDKEQATAYILARLKLGDEKISIAHDLSHQLNAPQNIILRFIDRVAGSYKNEISPNQDGSSPSFSPPRSTPLVKISADEPSHQIASPENNAGLSDPNRASAEHLHLPEDEPHPPNTIDNEALSGFVLENLKKHRRHNDIVEEICKRTGWSWNDSQRFVARTQTEKHAEIAKSKKTFMIPFSIGFILGGGLLLLWSAAAIFDYYNAITHREYSALSSDFIPLVIGALIASFGIIAGGIIGLYRTLAQP